MKSQGKFASILASLVAMLALGSGTAYAQSPPVYIGPGAPPPFEPPRYVRAEPLPDDVLLPQEIIGILRSTGFSPLSAPLRRGRFYVVAALHPDGEDGQVTIDAITGRFVRFVPADMVGRSMASYPPPPFALHSHRRSVSLRLVRMVRHILAQAKLGRHGILNTKANRRKKWQQLMKR